MEARICSACLDLGILLLQMWFVSADEVVECTISRDSIPAGRKCRKSCRSDADCLSWKKTCKCDGVCGRSCIKEKLKCYQLADIRNGDVKILPKNQFGAVAQYTCDRGYRLLGNNARVCQGDEAWSGEEPSCLKDNTIRNPECSTAPVVANAVHDGTPGMTIFSINTMLKYTCERGSTLEQDMVVTALCVGTDKWAGPNMSCKRVECSWLPNIANGWVQQDDSQPVIGTTAIYHCHVGYVLSGQPKRACAEDGSWDGVEPHCGRVACGSPPTVANAIHDGGIGQRLFPAGAQLTYACAYGYVNVGTSLAVCQDNGDWVGLTITCLLRRCDDPRDIEHGYASWNTSTYQSKVTYACNQGYRLIGRGYRTCQANGLWAGDVPICQPVKCQTLFPPLHGRLLDFDGTFGAMVRFACNLGYMMFGSSNRTCLANRTWSGTPTKCVEIDCGRPEPFYNGQIIGEPTTMGSKLIFKCNVRTTFDSLIFETVCKDNGQWSHRPPICWGQCQVPHMENATVFDVPMLAYVNHGTTIEFRCNQGLQPRSAHRIDCNNGTWSDVVECIPAPCTNTPPHVPNGLRVFLGQDHGFRAKYKCFAGYRLAGMRTTYLTCAFSQWVGGTPECKEYYCPSPGTIDHGSIYKRGAHGRLFVFQPYIRVIRHGHQLEYKCDRGYQINGPEGATCVNGQWQPPLQEPSKKCIPAIHPPFEKLWTPINNIRSFSTS